MTRGAENTETSGGTRYSSGKPGGWWYVPLYGLRLVSPIASAGASSYAELDWAEGQSFSTLIDCAFRHFLEILTHGPWAKDDGPKGTGGYHVGCLLWNILCLATFMAMGRHDLDDVTPYHGVTAEGKRKAQAYADEHGISILDALRRGGPQAVHEVMGEMQEEAAS